MSYQHEMYSVDGDCLTVDEVRAAVRERRAVIIWSHGESRNIASLRICVDAETAMDVADEIDTRGDCWSMWEETWGYLATDERIALKAARGALVQY